MNKKITLIKNRMKDDNIDIAFFNNPHNIQYLTGFKSEPHERILALILFQNGSRLLFTPALDADDAINVVDSSIEVFSYLDTENPWKAIQEKIEKQNLPTTNWAIEKQDLPVFKKEALEEVFPESHISFDYSSLMDEIRIEKDEEELEFMKESGKWADKAIEIGASILREGITEQEVVAEIEFELKKQGISEMSFDTMVLFGPNAASPHGIPGNTKLEKNQFVLFDLGVMYKHYASDITRTLFFGTDEPTDHQREIYELVLKAHDDAMEQAKIGMTAGELDHIARSVIEAKGYGEYFNHRLGHGLGQSVHEYPSIMAGSELLLTKHITFSIEPGIYLPNDVGVRIEDCGYMNENGFQSFTFFPTDINAYSNFIN